MGLISRVSSRTYRKIVTWGCMADTIEFSKERISSQTEFNQRVLKPYRPFENAHSSIKFIRGTRVYQLLAGILQKIWNEFLQLACGDAAYNYQYRFYDEAVAERSKTRVSKWIFYSTWPLSYPTLINGYAQFLFATVDASWAIYRGFLCPLLFGTILGVVGLEIRGYHIHIHL